MENLKSILDIDIPQTLYHYTDANAFMGMITKHEFWASHIRFMNDYTEFKLAKDKFIKMIPEFINGKFPSGATSPEKVVKDFECLTGKIDVFIVSLSEKEDELNQWRAYGKSIPNYSLAFNKDSLVENSFIISKKEEIIQHIEDYVYKSKRDPISRILLPCIYDKAEQEKLLKEILEDSYRKVSEKKETSIEFTKYIARKFIFYAPLIKNNDYVDEKEWRIVVIFDEHDQRLEEKRQREENNKSIIKDGTLYLDKLLESKNEKSEKIDFRCNGSYFIPYYKLGFKDNNCIEKVFIGACPDYDTVYESVEYMLRKNGIGLKRIKDEAIIQKSKLAYRNW